ncbi:hypothetical protein [Aeromonas sp. R7-5]|uniref:hypothetical protein n=1 Tax=Aeromonas sp. R7-5 TaxID=3138477 RepID=UPI0034A2BEFF
MQKRVIPWHRMTTAQAMNWLVINDPEGNWMTPSAGTQNLQEAVGDNLQSFGEKPQSGDVIATLEE